MTSLVKVIQERLAKICDQYVKGSFPGTSYDLCSREIATAIRAADLSDLEPDSEADGERLDRIKEIIINVDNRCMAADGPVTPTNKEITDTELQRIYALTCRKPESWRPNDGK